MDHYLALGLSASDDREAVLAAYRQRVAHWTEQSLRATTAEARLEAERGLRATDEAFHVLADPQRRQAYDLTQVDAAPRRIAVTRPITVKRQPDREAPPPPPQVRSVQWLPERADTEPDPRLVEPTAPHQRPPVAEPLVSVAPRAPGRGLDWRILGGIGLAGLLAFVVGVGLVTGGFKAVEVGPVLDGSPAPLGAAPGTDTTADTEVPDAAPDTASVPTAPLATPEAPAAEPVAQAPATAARVPPRRAATPAPVVRRPAAPTRVVRPTPAPVAVRPVRPAPVAVAPARPAPATYVPYTSARQGVRFVYPSSVLSPQSTADDGSAQTFVSAERNMSVSVRTQANASGESLSAAFAQAARKDAGRDVTYTASGASWYVVSGYEGDTLFYEKTLLNNGAFKTLRISFPRQDRARNYELVETMSNNFRSLD